MERVYRSTLYDTIFLPNNFCFKICNALYGRQAESYVQRKRDSLSFVCVHVFLRFTSLICNQIVILWRHSILEPRKGLEKGLSNHVDFKWRHS